MSDSDRRGFLGTLGTTSLALAGVGAAGIGETSLAGNQGEQSMSPNEDLMQEHALLNRVLLVYEECARRLSRKADLDPATLRNAAQVIRRFVESYHEKLEEDYVFPRFEKARKMTGLVATLRDQHKAGRVVTQAILSLATASAFRSEGERAKLINHLQAFVRMYRPHEAREGSVLFPAFRNLLPAHEFNELGEMFERKEHEMLGSEGFEGQVAIVDGLERKLGILDLAQFTPRLAHS